MKSLFFRVINFIFFLFLGFGLLYWAFRGTDVQALTEKFRSANYYWVGLSLFFGMSSHLVRGYRWKLIIKTLGYTPSLRNTFGALMVGYLANFALPRIGEVTRCLSLYRTDRIPVDRLVGTVILERIVDMLVFGLLLLLLLLTRFEFFGSFLNKNIFLPMYGKVTGIMGGYMLLLLFAALIVVVWLAWRLFRRRLRELKVVQKLKDLVRNIWMGLTSIFRMKDVFAFLLSTLMVWVLYLVQTYLVFLAFPFTEHLTLFDGIFVLVMATLGFIVPVQGAIGAFHWAVTLGLTLYGIVWEDGLVFATVSHTSGSLVTILLGVVALFLVWFGANKKDAVQTP